MAWTTPATVINGQTISSSFWNQQVRDNLNEIYQPPIVSASRIATQNIPKLTWTDISFDTEVVDNVDGFTPTSTNITCKKTGIYRINYSFFLVTDSGVFLTGVTKNGVASNISGSYTRYDGTGGSSIAINEEFFTSLVNNDFLRLRVFTNDSAATSPLSYAYLSMVFVGAS